MTMDAELPNHIAPLTSLTHSFQILDLKEKKKGRLIIHFGAIWFHEAKREKKKKNLLVSMSLSLHS